MNYWMHIAIYISFYSWRMRNVAVLIGNVTMNLTRNFQVMGKGKA